MSRRTDAAFALVLALGFGCSGGHTGRLEEATVGHHHVRFLLPTSWEHLDHGREQLLRQGEAQLTLADLGPATSGAMALELERARELWLAGRRLDAFEHVRELRSPALRYASSDQRTEFWQPWADVTFAPAAPDSAAIGPAFDALIRGADKLAPPTQTLLFQYVSDLALSGRGQEIAARERRTIQGSDWVVVDLWDRVSHGGRTRVAFTVSGGYLLALTMDRGLPEQLRPAFESVLASMEVVPAGAR